MSAAGYVTGRAYRRAVDSVRCPVLMLHGTLDRLIPVGMARLAARAHPAWSLVVLPGVGHVPQLEVPGVCAAEIREWLGPAGRGAASAAAGPPGRAPGDTAPPRAACLRSRQEGNDARIQGRPAGRRLE